MVKGNQMKLSVWHPEWEPHGRKQREGQPTARNEAAQASLGRILAE